MLSREILYRSLASSAAHSQQQAINGAKKKERVDLINYSETGARVEPLSLAPPTPSPRPFTPAHSFIQFHSLGFFAAAKEVLFKQFY